MGRTIRIDAEGLPRRIGLPRLVIYGGLSWIVVGFYAVGCLAAAVLTSTFVFPHLDAHDTTGRWFAIALAVGATIVSMVWVAKLLSLDQFVHEREYLYARASIRWSLWRLWKSARGGRANVSSMQALASRIDQIRRTFDGEGVMRREARCLERVKRYAGRRA